MISKTQLAISQLRASYLTQYMLTDSLLFLGIVRESGVWGRTLKVMLLGCLKGPFGLTV